MWSLGKVDEFASLYLDAIVVVDDVVTRLQATVMEVLVLINSRVVVVRERGSPNTCTAFDSSHVVPNRVFK